ncbi:F0F1 ATP synthase subunit delta [Ornithinimicrobium cerasi]|uniref:F0F1 ATP synthase subunit delta n=1 Tax=Ornithinimicrobium cerasi TaxID=2248773 RepID=UPI000EFF1352|nr:F0F1 ATP synthase subunit delta [Ornithinimicrobium cerasi]
METSAFRRAYSEAEAALEEVLRADGIDVALRVAEELWAVARLVDGTPTLRRNLADPSREGADRAALAQGLLTGKVHGNSLHIVRAVVAQRWPAAGDLGLALERLGVEAVMAHAQHEGRLGQVEDELFRFDRIVGATPDLQAALADRRADAQAKGALVERLLSVRTAPQTVRLAKQAVAGVRGRRFDLTVASFLEQAAARQDQVSATVTTAVPLSATQLDRLEAALSSQYGRQIHTNVIIDEGVVGGIRVEIGDEIIDGTVGHRLVEARRQMTS